MRLALLTPEWWAGGGIATYCRALAGYAVGVGHDVTVIAPHEARPADRDLVNIAGVRLVHAPQAGGGAESTARQVAGVLGRLAAGGLRPDVVEAAEFAGVAAFVPELPDPPPLVTRLHTPLALLLERNDGERIYRDDANRCALEARQVSGSALLTSPSRWLAGEARRLWHLGSAPVVAPNPVDIPAPHCVVARGGPSVARAPGPIRLLYLGRLEYRKGVLTLAAALRQWWEHGGVGEMAFVGGDTRWRGVAVSRRLRDELGALARPPWCRFLGAVGPAAVGAEIDRADVVVLPSLYENFPYSCLEAMARGKVVLATTGSGFPELIEHGRTGVLVPPGDSHALAAAITSLAANVDGLATLGGNARVAVTQFSTPLAGARLCELLTEVVERRGQPTGVS